MKKRAVILFNLGGPDKLESVRPFLRNLFNDKAIINLPGLLRYFISWLIAFSRDKEAKKIYEKIGGKSPLLDNTKRQAFLLEKAFIGKDNRETRCLIAMRYWHPFLDEAVQQLIKWKPDEIVLVPLYPHFSTTTSGSSLDLWSSIVKKEPLLNKIKTFSICCYYNNKKFIKAHVDKLKSVLEKKRGKCRVLFSAHGLPKKIIDKGDPYQWQVEQSVAKIVLELKLKPLDYTICYQSKVGPLEWIGPSTEDEIVRAGNEGLGTIVVPIAFVSEHSETLVELDLDYKELARKSGVAEYYRVPALGDSEIYIDCLVDLISNVEKKSSIKPACIKVFSKCYNKKNGVAEL